MSTGKKIGIAFAVILLLLCLAVDAWYVYLLVYGKDKLAVNTIYGGVMETVDGSDSRYIGKIKYNSNANGNGHEVFSYQLNYFSDEGKSSFHSQGFQYETENVEDSLEWYTYSDFVDDVYSIDNIDQAKDVSQFLNESNFIGNTESKTKNKGLWTGKYYARYVNPVLKTGISTNYQSSDDFVSFVTTNPITPESCFTIQTGEGEDDLVYMRFLGGEHADFNDSTWEWESSRELLGTTSSEGTFNSTFNYYYYNYSADWFGYFLYNAVKELPAGTKGTYTFEFGDYFRYFEVAEDGSVGEEIFSGDRANVISSIKSYFVFEVEVSANGARSAEDSLFGILHGSASYSVDGYDGTDGDYLTGAPIYDIDINSFDLVKLNDTDIALKLKDEFVSDNAKYANNIYLNIVINKTLIEAQGYTYVGFTSDSGLDKFKIYQIKEV